MIVSNWRPLLKMILIPCVCSVAIADDLTCDVPEQSQWNWNVSQLVAKTKSIVVAKALSSAHSGKRPDVRPDFKVGSGLSAHGKVDSKGRQGSQQDDVWSTTKTTFEVVDSIKGSRMKGDKFVLVTMDASVDLPERKLTYPLCDLPLKFEIGRSYLIFLNSFNANGYQAVAPADDSKVEEIRKSANGK